MSWKKKYPYALCSRPSDSDEMGQQIWDLWESAKGKHDDLFELLRQKFGWTVGQSYMATGWLYRPKENYN